MSAVLDNLSTKFCAATSAASKMAESSTMLSRMTDTLATTNAFKYFDTEVNHRPAVQQWAVCTP